ncbi:hypothetical protein [Marinigracilibium pacificum]|uniref:Uncharacterized protein n=1 Tax=Marinigracilibium pacificum TaxID=2729599 RepID=A0A848IZR4_9BACT|nr:hypothetical protein [Marinigracilibium pacificum]NMM48775.1 hypothetical protein [Marinigracilibium pacificum]
MLGIALLYWIGKYFYNLADQFNRSKWGFAILGIVIYFIGTVIGGIILGLIEFMLDVNIFTDLPDIVLNLLTIPFGILCDYILYKVLEKSWSKRGNLSELETIDGGMLNQGR